AAQVAKLADRGDLPGRKVAGAWKFSRAEIHHWIEERLGVSDEAQLAQMEDVLQETAPPGEGDDISVVEMLPVEAVAVPLEARTRAKVITAMADLAEGTGLLWDARKLADAVRAREDMQPTALDNGVALLHPRRPLPAILGEAFLALGITATGIPFGGRGGQMTDIFFLICSVSDRGHLRTLARISRLISDSELLTQLRAAPDAQTAHDLIRAKEEEIT
ncbi:MAG: PTS sugar transporter subunit IIA, partial [Planctomycetales bacterium]|nr:PTS sugar transporter subunit IIA [Planctomycetales bacterium]